MDCILRVTGATGRFKHAHELFCGSHWLLEGKVREKTNGLGGTSWQPGGSRAQRWTGCEQVEVRMHCEGTAKGVLPTDECWGETQPSGRGFNQLHHFSASPTPWICGVPTRTAGHAQERPQELGAPSTLTGHLIHLPTSPRGRCSDCPHLTDGALRHRGWPGRPPLCWCP